MKKPACAGYDTWAIGLHSWHRAQQSLLNVTTRKPESDASSARTSSWVSVSMRATQGRQSGASRTRRSTRAWRSGVDTSRPDADGGGARRALSRCSIQQARCASLPSTTPDDSTGRTGSWQNGQRGSSDGVTVLRGVARPRNAPPAATLAVHAPCGEARRSPVRCHEDPPTARWCRPTCESDPRAGVAISRNRYVGSRPITPAPALRRDRRTVERESKDNPMTTSTYQTIPITGLHESKRTSASTSTPTSSRSRRRASLPTA